MELSFWLSPVVLGVFGLCIGSFLNVVIYRLPLLMERGWWQEVCQQLADADSWKRCFGSEQPKPVAATASELEKLVEKLPPFGLAKPASRCPHCGHQIRWHENIPVLGWLRLGGRCSSCKAAISIRYPLVELATGLLFAGAAWRFGAEWPTLAWCAMLAVLVALTGIDWDTTLLPDDLTLPLLWGGLVVAALGWTVPLATAVWGAVVGYLALWSVYWLFKLTTGKEGMGYGDFKLLAALGAWLGWQAILPIVLMSSVVGAVIGLGLKFSGGLRQGRYIPFGPFLAMGGMVVIFAGTQRVLGWIGQ